MTVRVQITPFDSGAELNAFQQGRTDAGATVSFIGTVRDMTDGQDVTGLSLDHYPGLTEAALEAIETEARRRFNILDALIIHRAGDLTPGDPIVLVATAAAHRRPAFHATDFIMDALKTDAPFWKKETGPDGARWIEPRPYDRASRNLWRET